MVNSFSKKYMCTDCSRLSFRGLESIEVSDVNKARNNHGAENTPKDRCDNGRQKKFVLHTALGGRARLSAGTDIALFRLSANARWENRKQSDPPNQDISNNGRKCRH